MYNTLVVPYFDYCSSVWGCIGKCQSKRLQKLQNRTARIIPNSDYMTPSSCLLHDLGWDTLEKKKDVLNSWRLLCIRWSIITFVFAFMNFFKQNRKLRDSAHNLFIPRPLAEAGKRSSLHYRGATLWNSLSTTSKTQITVTGFKESLLT